MLGIGFSRALAASGFQHRATAVPGGRIVYRLADKSGHVGLDADEWRAVGEYFAARTRPVVRTTNWLLAGLFPATFLFGMTIAQVLPGSGLVVLAAILLGPIAIYLWQSRRIERIARAIEVELARLPRVAAAPAEPWRTPRWIEIAALVLIGPHLIVQAYGSLNPEAFRNTPWTGAHLDASGIAGLIVLAVLLALRWRTRRQAAPAEPEGEAAGRKVDIVARARRDAI